LTGTPKPKTNATNGATDVDISSPIGTRWHTFRLTF
jgi:hypothetical protein